MIRNATISLVFGLSILAVSPVATFAGGGKAAVEGHQRGPAAAMIDAIEHAATADAVKLDADQKTKVHAVVEDAMAQVQAMQADRKAEKGAPKDKGERQAAREKFTELMQQTLTKVESLLTDEQKPAFKAALKDEREKAQQARADRRGQKGSGAGGKANKV